MSDTSSTTNKQSIASQLQGKGLTERDHMDPDKHWIGESLPVATQTEIAATIGDISGPGDSPFPAKADHMHKLGTNVITGGNIQDGSITSAKIADGTIVGADIASGAITSAKIADGTIVGADVASGTITDDKLASLTRWRATRAPDNIGTGDSASGGTLTVGESVGGWTGAGSPASPLIVPTSGSYAISLFYSGVNWGGAGVLPSNALIDTQGVSYYFPLAGGTTNFVGATMVIYLSQGDGISFRIRNNSGAIQNNVSTRMSVHKFR